MSAKRSSKRRQDDAARRRRRYSDSPVNTDESAIGHESAYDAGVNDYTSSGDSGGSSCGSGE